MTFKYEEYLMKYKAQGGMNTARRPRLVMRTPSDFHSERILREPVPAPSLQGNTFSYT